MTPLHCNLTHSTHAPPFIQGSPKTNSVKTLAIMANRVEPVNVDALRGVTGERGIVRPQRRGTYVEKRRVRKREEREEREERDKRERRESAVC